jgi:hypothetical protein
MNNKALAVAFLTLALAGTVFAKTVILSKEFIDSNIPRAANAVPVLRFFMKDPDSFVLEGAYLKAPNKRGISDVCFVFRSHNSFGGYSGSGTARLNSKDVVDEVFDGDMASSMFNPCSLILESKWVNITAQVEAALAPAPPPAAPVQSSGDPCSRLPEGANGCKNGRTVDRPQTPTRAEIQVLSPNAPAQSAAASTTWENNAPRSTDEETAEISSDPLGADIEIDGNFVGNTPSSVGIAAGQHTLRVSKNGYKSWERTLRSSTGSIKIAAVLEPISADAPRTAHTPVEVAATSTSPDPTSPANWSEGTAEEARIGISFTGNPATRHDGLEIAGVQPKGPADNIDIKPGDVLISIDGHYLYTVDELRAELLRHESAARLAIRYRRDRLTYDNYLSLSPKGATPPR